MARVKRSVNGKKHRRAVLEEARGYTGSRSRHFKAANEQVMHSLRYAYRDRRARKGEFRRLWIARSSPTSRCVSRRRSAPWSTPPARPSTPRSPDASLTHTFCGFGTHHGSS